MSLRVQMLNDIDLDSHQCKNKSPWKCLVFPYSWKKLQFQTPNTHDDSIGYNLAVPLTFANINSQIIYMHCPDRFNPFSPGDALRRLLQIKYTLIRQLLEELSDQGILYLPTHGPRIIIFLCANLSK